ncbi:hypothetical protein R3P38DRAFT_2763620 [Favolaschia claudopus]|uniref:Uncharacterized protein n=1 Tax=Favolaschia claudopus TaxID=2862362 RepID=A0AAW0DHK1_9AGAR
MSVPSSNACDGAPAPDSSPAPACASPSSTERKPPKAIEPYITHGIRTFIPIDHGELDFNLPLRLQQFLALADPSFPYPGDPLPLERPPPAQRTDAFPPAPGTVRVLPSRKTSNPPRDRGRERQLERTKLAGERSRRHKVMLHAAVGLRSQGLTIPGSGRRIIRIHDPPRVSSELIDERDYGFDEVVGKDVRVVAARSRAAVIFAGCPTVSTWKKKVLQPINERLYTEFEKLSRRCEYPNEVQIMSGGVGVNFNEARKARVASRSRVLDALAFGGSCSCTFNTIDPAVASFPRLPLPPCFPASPRPRMAAPNSDSDTADHPPPLERIVASPMIDSEPICRAWAQLNPVPYSGRQMGAGGRRHSLLDDEMSSYRLYHQYRFQHHLKYARGYVMSHGLRVRADKILQSIQSLRLLPPGLAPAPRKRIHEDETVDDEELSIRPQTKKLKF